MDFPYLAVLWNPRNPTQSQAATQMLSRLSLGSWQLVLQHTGLAVYIQETQVPYLEAHTLREGNGVILGVLFDRSRNHRVSANEIRENSELAQISAATVRRLTQNYWGGYVALLTNRHTGEWWVLRDCSGMLSCYYATVRGITLVSSDARNFLGAAAARDDRGAFLAIEINWQYMAGFLAHSQLQIRETGLKNIYELLAGETLRSAGDCPSVEFSWNPATFSNSDPWESLDEHCLTLRTTVQSCIDAWASIHDWVVHSLSGGFDSSLVLSLLSRSPKRPHVVCVNRFSTGPAEDERHYARIAARATNTPLVEWPWVFGHHTLDASCINLPIGAKPTINALVVPLETAFFLSLKSAHRFDAIWSGEGGDHLFLALNTALIVSDFLRVRGFRSGLLATLRDASRLTGRSIPALALNTTQRSVRGASNSIATPPVTNFLLHGASAQRCDLNTYIQHPWTNVVQKLPPGKRQQILLLAEVLHRLRPLPATQEAVELRPLLSQPVIEQCLRIPTYDLLHGGVTRSLARRAFAAQVPSEILKRELKGQTTHHALGLLHNSLPLMSEFLLNGVLMQQQLLDRTALEPLVTQQIPISAETLFPLFACLSGELWARAWLGIDSAPSADHSPVATVAHSTRP